MQRLDIQTPHLVPTLADDKEYSRILFNSFRKTFTKERQPERAIFWIEEKFGKLFIRHVKDLKRQKKSDDILVNRCINDINAVKIIIGNYAADCDTSIMCWELYSDFELTNLLEEGRFDHLDLLSGIQDNNEILMLSNSGVIPSRDWDFDNILLMHKCPYCGGVYNRNFILFKTNIRCENCQREIKLEHGVTVIKKMIQKAYNAQTKLYSHFHDVKNKDEFAIQYYVNPMVNSVICWILFNNHLTDNKTLSQYEDQILAGTIQYIYNSSLFKLLTCKDFKFEFLDFLSMIDPTRDILDHDFTLTMISNIGKSLFEELTPQNYDDLYYDIRKGYVGTVIPLLINHAILNHQNFSKETI